MYDAMRINSDLFKTVLEELGGKEAVEIASVLINVPETTDEGIATKTGLRLNVVRKVLYKLHSNSLASYRRIRDQSTGWFIYFWKLNPDRAQYLINKKKKTVLNLLEQRLEYEKNNVFYVCKNNDTPLLTFDEAMEYSFKCPHCDMPLIYFENKAAIEFLQKRIDEIKRDLSKYNNV